MEGFYTKEEAAHVLGVSVRQINNYFAESKLSRVYQGRRAWVPRGQVEALYARIKRGPILSQEVVDDLAERVGKLENHVEVLKLGLGFGAKRPRRNDTDLILLRQQMVDALTKTRWGNRQISKVADELKTIREDEVAALLDACGHQAWIPMMDLSQRMLSYVEGREDYPSDGLDVLAKRLYDGRDRFYGLIYVCTKTKGLVPSAQAAKALEAMVVPVNSIERHITAYLASQ